MQRLAWSWINSEREAGRCCPSIPIPEVYWVFTAKFKDKRGRGYEWTFLVMELLDAITLHQVLRINPDPVYQLEACYDLIAEGIQTLRKVPVPSDATPGPYTSDPKLRVIRYPLFKRGVAATVYQSVDELQKHMNQVRSKITWNTWSSH